MQGEILVLLVKTCKLSYNNTEQCSHPKDRIFLRVMPLIRNRVQRQLGDDEVRDGVEEARRQLQGHGGADH